MTELLRKAFQKASGLSEEIQDSIASRILLEIEDEEKWQRSFESSNENLKSLSDKALSEHNSGNTKEIGFDELLDAN